MNLETNQGAICITWSNRTDKLAQAVVFGNQCANIRHSCQIRTFLTNQNILDLSKHSCPISTFLTNQYILV
uniref:Uncharacterized protein n=2 Tax=Arion vulgaris TaxID=1028688 RepID=A0A0B6ZI35_9EUPU